MKKVEKPHLNQCPLKTLSFFVGCLIQFAGLLLSFEWNSWKMC